MRLDLEGIVSLSSHIDFTNLHVDSIKDINKIKKDLDPTRAIKKELTSVKETVSVFEKEIKNLEPTDKKNK